jgi:tRNA A-37 threonylcarbamoyl transferase component Bud32
MATVSSNGVNGRPSPGRTRPLLRGVAAESDDTSFELGSAAAVRLIQPRKATAGDKLDPATRDQFHVRLRLCCLIATVPLAFFFINAVLPFIDLFGYRVVGPVGAAVGGAVLVVLAVIGVAMFRYGPLPERWLRVLELAVFGQLALFFAYWQFAVQTARPDQFYEAVERETFPESPRTDAGKTQPAAAKPPDVPTPMPESPPVPLPMPPELPPQPVAEPPAGGPMPAAEPPPFVPPRESKKAPERSDPFRKLTQIHERIQVIAAALVTHFNWLLLIVFHAVLVPNTLGRGAGVTAGMAVVPLGIDAVVVGTHGPAAENAIALFAVAVTMLAAGGGLAIFGTAKTAELQRQVESAREAVREMGQYRLRRKLGSGGMGEVYLAEHRMLKRPCALKRIHAKYLHSPDQLRRFEREVQATAQLRHPNTVEIYDYGVADDGTFYYVMEYLPGMSLEELVGKFGPLPAERVLHLLRQVCGALREAHARGLVHRDIKPSNVVVFPAGSPHDQVKLVDFGLVHSLAEVDNPDAKITRDGLIVGTPEYMSPEQASGGVLDGRSDLFSLGSVAYYLLTGREAFHRENPMKTLMAVVSDTPAPVAEFNPFVPDDVLAVVGRCLDKDPGQRFQSAADLEHAMAECGCAGQWTEERSNDWWATNPSAQPGTGTDLATLPLRDSRVE